MQLYEAQEAAASIEIPLDVLFNYDYALYRLVPLKRLDAVSKTQWFIWFRWWFSSWSSHESWLSEEKWTVL